MINIFNFEQSWVYYSFGDIKNFDLQGLNNNKKFDTKLICLWLIKFDRIYQKKIFLSLNTIFNSFKNK
jgi:hypothetical protein